MLSVRGWPPDSLSRVVLVCVFGTSCVMATSLTTSVHSSYNPQSMNHLYNIINSLQLYSSSLSRQLESRILHQLPTFCAATANNCSFSADTLKCSGCCISCASGPSLYPLPMPLMRTRIVLRSPMDSTSSRMALAFCPSTFSSP